MLYGQQQQMKFDYITTKEGLSNNRVSVIFRDCKGYVWFGSQAGIDRYDGYQLTSFRYRDGQKDCLSDNNVNCIIGDKAKNLWVGTIDGLNLFEPFTQSFKVFKKIPNDSKSISSNYINTFFEDSKGRLWIGNGVGGGINQWISAEHRFQHFSIPSADYKKTETNCITSIREDSRKNLWVVGRGDCIFLFVPEKGLFVSFNDSNLNLGRNTIKNLFIDDQDLLWITTEGAGLFSFQPSTHKFKKYGYNNHGTGVNGMVLENIIQQDKQHLLIAVDQGGINRFNKLTGTFEYIMYDDRIDHGLNNNGIWNLYKDKEGILWVGTSARGVNYYNPKKQRFKLFQHIKTMTILCAIMQSYASIKIPKDLSGLVPMEADLVFIIRSQEILKI